MNLFPATVLAGGAVDIGGPVLQVGPRLPAGVGADVIIGLRPEAFTDAALDPDVPGDRVVEVEVDLVEARGAELVVHTLLPGPDGHEPAERTRLVARLSPKSRVRPGDVVKLAVDTDEIHVFDPETGAARRRNR